MEKHASYIDSDDGRNILRLSFEDSQGNQVILGLPSDDSQGDQVKFYQTGYKSNGILFSDTIGFDDFLRQPDITVPKQNNCIIKEDCL